MASIVLPWEGVGNALTIMPAKKSAKKSTPATPPPTREPRAAPRRKSAETQAADLQPARKTRTRASSKSAAPDPAANPDAVAREAYLVYRHRVEHGLPGDAESDWLEAENRLNLRS